MQTIQVGVVMGSSSDWDTMVHATDILTEFGVGFEAKVISAHRMPDAMFAYADEAAARGLQAIIAGAAARPICPACWLPRPRYPFWGFL